MKVGTVGTNFVVSDLINASREVDGIEIAAVYSRTAEQAEAFAEKHSVPHKYWDREAFLASDKFDVVYVASPNSLHYQWTKDALLAGKHVMCEKPFVSTLKEAEELVSLAKERGLLLFEAITIPHMPNYKLLKEHLGDVGDMKIVQLNFSQYSSRYEAFMAGKVPNVFNPEFSGGALMDINYYNLYFVTGLLGRPNTIHYFANTAEGIDTSGLLVMEYDGFVVSAIGCKDSKSENKTQIQGDKGFIVIPEESSRMINFKVVTKAESKEYNVQDRSTYYYELHTFEEIYRNKDFKTMGILLEQSLLVTGLIEEARKKAGIFFPADSQ